MAQTVKNLPAMQETWVLSLGCEDPLEEGMATHSSILAWRIPMERGAWRAIVYGVAESDTTEQLSTENFWNIHCYHTELRSTCPTHSKVNLLKRVVVKESTALTAGSQAREWQTNLRSTSSLSFI